MASTQDYQETRSALIRAMQGLDRARTALGRTNISPRMGPNDVSAQINNIAHLIAEVTGELDSAREACSRAGRRGLTICN